MRATTSYRGEFESGQNEDERPADPEQRQVFPIFSHHRSQFNYSQDKERDGNKPPDDTPLPG
jgi:hypothetical protein